MLTIVKAGVCVLCIFGIGVAVGIDRGLKHVQNIKEIEAFAKNIDQ